MRRLLIAALLLLWASAAWGGMQAPRKLVKAAVGGSSTTWGPTAISVDTNDVFSIAGIYDATSATSCAGDGDGCYFSTGRPMGGRWTTTIPEGATITDSEVRIYVGWPQDSSSFNIRIYGEDTAAANAYTDTTTAVTSRTLTTAYADFTVTGASSSPGAWVTMNSTALDNVIEEIASNSGFNGTISLAITMTSADNDIQIHALDSGRGTNIATLEVTYE